MRPANVRQLGLCILTGSLIACLLLVLSSWRVLHVPPCCPVCSKIMAYVQQSNITALQIEIALDEGQINLALQLL
jgi:hypothetical protein